MKNKLIRIIPPVTALVIAFLDAGAVFLLVLAILSIKNKTSVITVSLVIITIVNIFAAVKTTCDILLTGVLLREKSVEFTGIDENNTYYYKHIKSVETHKDTKASLKKNYVQRYSSVIIHLDDDSTATVELGFTTKKKLKKIEDELKRRIEQVD